MTVTKEILSDLKEKYEKAEKYVLEESKQDPPVDLFQSHYSALNILMDLEMTLNDLLLKYELDNDLETDSVRSENEDALLYRHILGFVLKDIGKIYVWTEELAAGEKHLVNCVEQLLPYKLHPECVNAYLEALNQLGILWSIRKETEKSKEYLLQAEKVYKDFKGSNKTPMTIYDLFGTKGEMENENGLTHIEKTHTLTLFYLAQTQLGDLHLTASYCHTTLKRQLEFDDYEPIDWVLNAATLSQYYCTNDRYNEARHHLAAATYILGKYEAEMFTESMSPDEKASVQERFNHRSADVQRCWAKYGLNLLSESKKRLMNDPIGEKSDAISHEHLSRFPNINIVPYEDAITDQYCLIYDDAKPVFLSIQNWLKKAKEYYTAESEASEYSVIIQDMANSYKYLAFFDFDEGNQCKLHKRRADLLEDLLNILNAKYYMAICRQLWHELGQTYSDILDIKLDIFKQLKIDEMPNPHILNKINMLCGKGIDKFITFIDSYKEKDSDELQKSLTTIDLTPIIFTYFQIGRLYYKIMTPDKQQHLQNIKNSYKYYALFVKYCDQYKEIGDTMKGEYGVCKEMTILLPLKIKKLEEEINACVVPHENK